MSVAMTPIEMEMITALRSALHKQTPAFRRIIVEQLYKEYAAQALNFEQTEAEIYSCLGMLVAMLSNDTCLHDKEPK